jgi:hypothetical protein
MSTANARSASRRSGGNEMTSRPAFAVSCILIAAALACAKVKVEERESAPEQRLPRPGHIYVQDFVAAPEDVPSDSSVGAHTSGDHPAQTPEQIALGRQVGSELAGELAGEIAAMGLPAVHATSAPSPAVDDLVIRGTLLSVVAGSEAERVAVGMGKGAAELKVAVEGYQMTASGLRKLGGGTLDTSAGKTPGAAVSGVAALATKNPIGLIVSTGVKLHDEKTGKSTIHGKAKDVAKQIATELRPRFESQGWIPPSQGTQ